MTITLLNKHHRIVGALAACLVAGGGCVADDSIDIAQDEAALSAAGGPITPSMTWLAKLPAEQHGEIALGRLFAHGTATYVPTGKGVGYPVLFSALPDLNWLASQLWGGKTFRVTSSDTHPNGDPIVRLDNLIIKTPAGSLFNLFDAFVTRSLASEISVGTNSRGEVVPPPSGFLAPVGVSFLKEPVQIDGKPSIWLNYFDDKTLPIIRRILDEIREVDAKNCPGLFLGRAHVRRCASLACGEVPSGLVDFPEKLTFDTKSEWKFWTYFLLNFGPADATCDLGAAYATVQRELADVGIDIDLPPPSN